MISSIIQGYFFLLKFSPSWVSKKRNDKESMICLTPKPCQFLCLPYIKQRKKNAETELFKENEE